MTQRQRRRHYLELLEPRRMLSATNPSGDEQQTLDLINRMRQNPAAELPLIENSTDTGVQSALKFFNVNLSVLASQWATLTPVPPLAWNADLAAASLEHDNVMVQDNSQEHQLPGELSPSQRDVAAGYTNFSTTEESIYAYATSVFDAHAAFAVDWGSGTGTEDGIQNPPGHRENLMSPAVTDLGVAIIPGPGNGDGTTTGPLVFTEDFGAQFNAGNPYLLGSVFNDTNGDGFYTAGEGLAGVHVHITGPSGTFDTTTLTAGGYQIQVPAGTYSVTFSGGLLAQPKTYQQVVVGSTNVERDFKATKDVVVPVAPAITSSNAQIFTTGTAGSFNITTTGTPTAAITETGVLPSGVTFTDNGNGVATLAGTPATGSGGIYTMTIHAKNDVTPQAKQTFTLTVDQTPAITSVNTTTFTIGTAAIFTIKTTGFPIPSITESGPLPNGVTFIDKGNGKAKLRGTPAVRIAASYPITLSAKNGVKPKSKQTFTLIVVTSGVGTSVIPAIGTLDAPAGDGTTVDALILSGTGDDTLVGSS